MSYVKPPMYSTSQSRHRPRQFDLEFGRIDKCSTWAGVAVGTGLAISGTMGYLGAKEAGGGQQVQGEQITTAKPAPRTAEGKTLLKTLMSEYFGGGEYVVGMKETLAEQEKYLGEEADKFIADYETLTSTYTDKLKGIETGGLLKPYSVTFGGESPISFVPKRNIVQAGFLSDLARNVYGAGSDVASKKMQLAEKYPPGWGQLAYLSDLWDKALPLETARYGVPSTAQTGSLGVPAPHWTTQAGNLMQLAKGGVDIYQAFKPPAPVPSTNPDLYGYGVGPTM